MKGTEFRKWAEHGCRHYGRDPWFLLRELAQNARDAGAKVIRVQAQREEGNEILEFTDDGSGMTFDHARDYLFRLYASSKDSDERSAGKYGIGFWSVLRFGPTHIVVESRTRRGGWGITIDENFELRKLPCGLQGRGTRITLIRKAVKKDEKAFRESLRRGLVRYCRYLRRNDRSSSKLPVIFDGENFTRSMRLGGMISYAFRERNVEGAVGLADTPKVYLHSRGLPVWKGAVLDELSHETRKVASNSELATGLAPVFLLNGNDLNVVMSRRAVVDDRALAKVRKAASNAMAKLVRLHMEHTFPRTLPRKAADAMSDGVRALRRVHPLWAVMVLCIALLSGLAFWQLPSLLGAGETEDVSILPVGYEGAVVSGPPGTGGSIVDLTYSPASTVWFKIMTADRWDPDHGFVTTTARHLEAPEYTCAYDCLDVRVKLDTGGIAHLPVPGGYAVEAGSLFLDDRPLTGMLITASGDTIVEVPLEGGILEYTSGPTDVAPLAATERKRLTNLGGGASIPDDIREVITRAEHKRTGTKIMTSLTVSRALIEYDTSEQTAKRYRSLEEQGKWFPFVVSIGRGDCDVLNGINALLLREMGIPARLAIGLVGHGGRTSAQLHAWTEYHDGQWKAVDATPTTALETAAPRRLHSADAPAGEPPSLGTIPKTTKGPTRSTEVSAVAAPTSEAPKPQAADPARVQLSVNPWWLVIGSSLILLTLVLVIALLLKREGWERMETAGDRKVAEHVLARILTSAAMQPGMWRHARELWSRQLLPTISGERISMIRARELARSGRLFIGTEKGALASMASVSGATVLDGGHRAFGSFLSSMPGVIDLDTIEGYRPRFDETEGPVGRLLGAANRILAVRGKVRVCRAPGLREYDITDVDLSALKLPASSGWPRRFIAVNPDGKFIQHLCDVAEDNLPRAAWELVQRLSDDAHLLRDGASELRARAATMMIIEAAV